MVTGACLLETLSCFFLFLDFVFLVDIQKVRVLLVNFNGVILISSQWSGEVTVFTV